MYNNRPEPYRYSRHDDAVDRELLEHAELLELTRREAAKSVERSLTRTETAVFIATLG